MDQDLKDWLEIGIGIAGLLIQIYGLWLANKKPKEKPRKRNPRKKHSR